MDAAGDGALEEPLGESELIDAPAIEGDLGPPPEEELELPMGAVLGLPIEEELGPLAGCLRWWDLKGE